MNRQVGAVLIVKDGKVLAVSRKDDPNDFGLPGGKLEENESFEDAAIRETHEETGLRTYNLTRVFEGTDAHGYYVVTFVPEKFNGKIHTSEEGRVKWVEPIVLTQGSFKDYNEPLLKKMNLI